MKTAHLPSSSVSQDRYVDDYGRNVNDKQKTKYRLSLEKRAKSDEMSVPIPLSELDKYTTDDLARYIFDHEKKEVIEQIELISKEAEFADKVRTDINNCTKFPDFLHMLHKYRELETNPAFRKDVINQVNQTLIRESETEDDLKDVWNAFKGLSVVEDPEDLLVTKIKERRSEINKLTL